MTPIYLIIVGGVMPLLFGLELKAVRGPRATERDLAWALGGSGLTLLGVGILLFLS